VEETSKPRRLAYDSEHGKLWQDIKADLDKTRARASKFAHDAEWAFGRRTVRVLAAVVLFAVVVALLVVFLNLYVAPTKPSEKKDLVLAVAQILAGTALLSGLYFTWRRVEISQRTLATAQDQQVTERFTRAIDQLGKTDEEGNKLLEIRLGGIYALERIARESEEDHWPIMEVLTAYVRQHSPRRPEEEALQVEEDVTTEKPEKHSGGSRGEYDPTEVPPADPDILAIMTVLRRRSRSWGLGEPMEPLDLHNTYLSRANLSGADLGEAEGLTQADLEDTTGNETTQLPPDLKPPAHWNVKTDEQIEED
jgi:hypothetical protein